MLYGFWRCVGSAKLRSKHGALRAVATGFVLKSNKLQQTAFNPLQEIQKKRNSFIRAPVRSFRGALHHCQETHYWVRGLRRQYA